MSFPSPPPPAPAPGSRTLRYVLLIGVLLTLAIAAGWAIHSLTGGNAEVLKNFGTSAGLDVPPTESISPPVVTPAAKPWLTAAEQAKVDAAVGRGVAYLKKCLSEKELSGNISKAVLNANSGIGWVGLAGLTLLHCDVPATDPAVQKAADVVRKSVPKLLNTYEMGACIWFLDRLNDPADQELIRMLALRLAAGQAADGGWPYFNPELSKKDQDLLLALLKNDSPPPADTPAEQKKLPVLKVQFGEKIVLGPPAQATSNSLTLFGMLGLWVARRHGVPADRSLALAEVRFRGSQEAAGSWWYGSPGWSFHDSGTCAGLLALALGRGVSRSSTGMLVDDPAVQKAFKFLGTKIGRPAVRKEPGPGNIFGADAWGDLFFLWALERMAMVYDVRVIDGKEWYPWGVGLLLPTQNDDGSWTAGWPGPVDTCFALLFLQRANVAQDLTSKLRQPGP